MKQTCLLFFLVFGLFSGGTSAAEYIHPKGAKTLNGDKTKLKIDATKDKAKVAISYLHKLDKKNALTFSLSQLVGDKDKKDDFSLDALKKGTKAKVSYMHKLTESKDAISGTSWAPSHFFLSVAANRESFTVLDSEAWLDSARDSAFKKSSKNGFEIGGALQWTPSKYTRIKLGYDFQHGYKQKGYSRQYCQVETPTTCVYGNSGKIKDIYYRNAYLHWGSYSHKGALLKGWDIQLTHNFSKHKTRIELPLYLYANKSDKISAGIKLQYLVNPKYDEDRTGMKVFLNVNFDFFK